MAGRRPKPSAIRELEGNRGHRPINKSEPKPSGIPTCPKHLDKVAQTEWKRISAELQQMGLLTAVDRAALAAYCQSYSRWAAAEAGLQKHGLVIKAPSGYPINSPYVGIANTALDQMRKFLVEFGLTPASRSRISTSGAEPQDSFEQFMASLGAADEIETDETEHSREIH